MRLMGQWCQWFESLSIYLGDTRPDMDQNLERTDWKGDDGTVQVMSIDRLITDLKATQTGMIALDRTSR